MQNHGILGNSRLRIRWALVIAAWGRSHVVSFPPRMAPGLWLSRWPAVNMVIAPARPAPVARPRGAQLFLARWNTHYLCYYVQ